MCPVKDFRVGLWIQEKALLKEGQEVKGDFFGTEHQCVQKEKQALETEKWKRREK